MCLVAQLYSKFSAAAGVKFEFRLKECLPEFIELLEPLGILAIFYLSRPFPELINIFKAERA